MKNIITLMMLSFALAVTSQTKITIDASKPGAEVSKNLYGIFFEDINHAGEGGIYGEMIQNRSLEANRLPEDMFRKGDYIFSKQGFKAFYPQPDQLQAWSIQLKGKAKGSISQDNSQPLNAKNLMAMKIVVENNDNGNFLIDNSGFWGINIIKGDKYKLSIYLSSETANASVKVMLRDDKDNVLASQLITGVETGWKKYNVVFDATVGCTNAKFSIAPLSNGTLRADMISLFPEKTFKGRENGLRNDLANLVADVKPGFIRFPGGCVVEGADLENRIIWKNTIGDISQRLGRWELWGYHNTDGLGFHEFLQFCEDLGCPGMYVVSVGMSCQFRRCEYSSQDTIGFYIQEVLDALEYAMGPATSKWGAERVKNGHPAPFYIKYLEIGNENYGKAYQERYNMFFKAVKEKYPQLQTITCTDPSMRDEFKRTDLATITQPIEMIDEHFYEGLDFFFKNSTRYDAYDRKGPQIYVGEYAVKKWNNTLRGNLEAAVAEAAFMTGFERNADIVKLSSYAPTFINENDITWNPDLVVYDNNKAYGTPSYYVQKLFSNNIPDKVLTTNVVNDGQKVAKDNEGVGVLSFANNMAVCRYKDILVKIGQKTYKPEEIFDEASLKRIKNNEVAVGKIDFVDIRFKPEIYKTIPAADWKNYTVSLTAVADSIDDLEVFNILFYSTGEEKHYKWILGRWWRRHFLQWYDHGYEGYFDQKPGEIIAGKEYKVEIKMANDSVFASLDGAIVHAVSVPKRVTPGIYATSGINKDGNIVLKVVNGSNAEQKIPVEISGSALKYKMVTAKVISGNPLDMNSFEKPLNIAPVESEFEIGSNTFEHVYPANSVSVLIIRVLK